MLLTVALLTACNTLLPMASKLLGTAASDGISVDAQMGDRENDVMLDGARATGDIEAKGHASVKVNNSQTDTNIESAESVTVQNIPPWVFLVALIGWIMPTPQSMYASLKARITNKFKKDS